jgi:drug/metabolite transporter (DMT)-like permease
LVICLVSRTPLSGYPTRSYVVMLGAALLPQLTGYLAIGYALGHIPAAIASPTMLGQPVITAILAIPILGERLTPPQWIGGLVALTGIYLVNRSREKPIEAVPIDEAPPLKGSTAEGKGRQTLDRRLDPK